MQRPVLGSRFSVLGSRFAVPLLALILTACAQPATFHFDPQISDARTGKPVQASLFVDGQPCAAPCQIPADGKRHAVKITAAGYGDWTQEIAANVAAGKRISGPVRLGPR